MQPAQDTETPSLPSRLIKVFLSPGELFDRLRKRPLWGAVLLMGAVAVAVSIVLIPEEIWTEMVRQRALESGQEGAQAVGMGGSFFRVMSVAGGVVGWVLWTFLLTAITTFVFGFVLGDEGRFVHYLSVVSHALFISAVGALATAPLKIAEGDPTLTLSVGTFAFFLEEGYLLRVLRLLDLFGLWSYAVMGVGVSRIDPRRSLGSATAFFMGFALAVALIFGAFAG